MPQRGIDDIGERVLAVHQAGHGQALVHRECPGTGVDQVEDKQGLQVEDVEGDEAVAVIVRVAVELACRHLDLEGHGLACGHRERLCRHDQVLGVVRRLSAVVRAGEPVDLDLDPPAGDRRAGTGLQVHPVAAVRLGRDQRLPQSRVERRAPERVVTGGLNRLDLGHGDLLSECVTVMLDTDRCVRKD
jgi:hypothetical protein